MAFTRFHDDPARIAIQLQQMTDQERYYLDTPGNGLKPAFMLDSHILAQKWGANVWTNVTDIQSSLLGIDRNLNRDCLDGSTYKKQTTYASPIDYPECDTFLTTEQSRASLPAWTFRDLEQNHGDYLPHNPQSLNRIEMRFPNNTSTRIDVKDSFVRPPRW